MFEGLDIGEKGALISSIGFAIIVTLALIPRLKTVGFARTLKMALGWILIFGGLILLVSQWQKIKGALDPASPISTAETVSVTARDDGHFYVRAKVNGVSVMFLVDTGASDIVLSRQTAARIGFDDSTLRYDGYAQTANGMVRIAGVRLDSIEVGSIALYDMRASVNGGEFDDNLLGMRFLNALRGWRVENGTLILTP